MWPCELPHELQLHQGNETSINVVSSTKRSMEISSVCDSIEIVCVTPVKDILVNIFQKAFQSITIGFSYDIRSQLIGADLSTSLLFHAIP